jgi:hypothetical protein
VVARQWLGMRAEPLETTVCMLQFVLQNPEHVAQAPTCAVHTGGACKWHPTAPGTARSSAGNQTQGRVTACRTRPGFFVLPVRYFAFKLHDSAALLGVDPACVDPRGKSCLLAPVDYCQHLHPGHQWHQILVD